MISSPSCRLLAGALLLLSSCPGVSAFQAPLPRSGPQLSIRPIPLRIPAVVSSTTPTSTQLSMSYKLPPSGGGGGGKDDNLVGQVLSGALTIGAIVLFFASPLGGIFFAITNSLFLLALVTPVVLYVAFQVWQSFNTVSGPCPNCGAPTRVMKDVEQPGLCFNCGSILQISPDMETIELSTPTKRQGGGFIDMDQPGAGMGGGGASIFDIFGGGAGPSSPEQPTATEVKQKEQKFRRDSTIVDVEVTKDD